MGEPAATVTEAGTEIAVEVVESFTCVAEPTEYFKKTVPAPLVPPITLNGLITMLPTKFGSTVSVTVFETPPNVALIVTDWAELTNLCVIVNVALDEPLATTMEPGTEPAAGVELESVTVSPVEGAGPLRVTLPVTVDVEPPITEA